MLPTKDFKKLLKLSSPFLLIAAVIVIAFISVLPKFPLLAFKTPLATSGQSKTIEFTANGFIPDDMAIYQGEAVTFVNKSNQNFWPASDPHPTHEYLKGFDAGKPIAPGGKWSYQFEKTGIFRYHDHLGVSQRGAINVLLPGVSQNSSSGNQAYCEGKCFDEQIRSVVRKDGIDAAYKLFSDKFAIGKLPNSCHWVAHQIGDAAYELFKEGKDFPISQATSYCGFGFYHGFMEKLLRDNPDTKYALSFCDKVKEKLGKMGLYNCIHGIGHGFTEDPPDPKTIGNANAMLGPGIGMCEKLFGKNFSDLNLCLTGVYTVVAGFADKEKYGLKWNAKDPFAFCKTQPYRYHKACFGEYAPKLDWRLNWDISGLTKYMNDIGDDKTRKLLVWVVPSVIIGKDILSNDYSKHIEECRKAFTGNLRKICWGGLILGFFSQGEPEKQYKKAIDFCNSNSFSSEEREFCFEEALRQARSNYSEEKMKDVCQSVPISYQKYCFKTYHDPPYDNPSFDT